MPNIECNDCGDMVDVEARTVTLPFVCKWCTEGFEPKTPLDSIIDESYEDWCEPCETETLTSTSTPSQFDLDSELIEDLQSQLEEANRNREEWIEKYASLITEIGIKDARIRVLESEAIERNSALEIAQPLLKDYVELLKGLVGLATTYQFEDNLEGLTFLLESQKKAIAARDEAVKELVNSRDYYQEKYFSERGKTWRERLWS